MPMDAPTQYRRNTDVAFSPQTPHFKAFTPLPVARNTVPRALR
jgi:hypothetical protein